MRTPLAISLVLAAAVCAAADQNNFVTPLSIADDGVFVNPRAGWVFVWCATPGAAPEVFLDDETSSLVWRWPPRTNMPEAMRYLGEGAHRLRCSAEARAALEVRAVPEIAFCYYPFNYNVAAFGAADRAFMDAQVFPDINTIVTRSGTVEGDPSFAQWRSEGRRWIANGHLPGLGASTPPAPDAIANEWLAIPGVTNPDYVGLIVDEFTPASAEHYRAWTDAVAALHTSPAMGGKTFYAWCVDIYRRDEQIAFCKKVQDVNGMFVWEKYLREEPTLEIAERWIDQSIAQRLEEWERAVPGVRRSLIVCLGYMSAPPESLDVDPLVDYSVFLDMQFHALATDPRFAGLRGVMPYMASYADEEYVRYAQRLIRHYCIEGNRVRMNNDPYVLSHVVNPDFANGLEGWTVDAAEDGAVSTGAMDGFSYLEGRYPRYREGDTYCRMKRSGARPNRVLQTARNLVPGRQYSLKMFSANIERLDQNAKTGFGIAIDGGDVVSGHTFDFVFPSCYSHEVPPYNANHPAHMTYHRRVFTATADTASIAFSDETAAPGETTVFNFVQVQPYHAAD